MHDSALSIGAIGPEAFVRRAADAADRIDARLVDPHATLRIIDEDTESRERIDVLLVHMDARRARSIVDALAPTAEPRRRVALIAAVPGCRGGERAALLQSGAADIVSPSIRPAELALRIQRAADQLVHSRRMRQQDRELVLITSLARKLIRTPGAESLVRDALAGLGRSLDLEAAEFRVLSAPWRVDAEASSVLRWERGSGVRRSGPVPLDPLDIEALRCRMPVPADACASTEVALPLLAKGQALAVLRASPSGEAPLGEDGLRTLYVIGSLLAGAMEHAEQLASLEGHSKQLEAQVAERTRAAEAQRQLFQAVVDALPVSLHAIDRAFRVVVWNRGREAGPFGRPRGEVLGHSLFSVIGDDEDLREEYEQVFDDGESRETELEGRAGNPPRLYRVEKVPMKLGRDDDVTHVITVSRDVTEQRALERSMARTEKMAAVGRLAAGIAHEINNPLATIAGCAEAMKSRLEGPLDDEDRQDIGQDAEVIEEEAYRCKDILGNLLDFSRTAPPKRGPCDLGEIARRTLRLLRHNPRIAGVHLELELDPAAEATIACDDQIVQALLALLLNAADAAAPGGNVVVRTRRGDEGETILSVEDDGAGIAPELQDRIFEPFFTTKPTGQGTGLGLAVAYGIVQAHGGRLEMISHPGLGTRFDIVLPVLVPEPAQV